MKNINENENTPPDTLPPKQTNEEWTELTDRHVNSIYRAFSLDTGNQRQDAHQSQVVWASGDRWHLWQWFFKDDTANKFIRKYFYFLIHYFSLYRSCIIGVTSVICHSCIVQNAALRRTRNLCPLRKKPLSVFSIGQRFFITVHPGTRRNCSLMIFSHWWARINTDLRGLLRSRRLRGVANCPRRTRIITDNFLSHAEGAEDAEMYCFARVGLRMIISV